MIRRGTKVGGGGWRGGEVRDHGRGSSRVGDEGGREESECSRGGSLERDRREEEEKGKRKDALGSYSAGSAGAGQLSSRTQVESGSRKNCAYSPTECIVESRGMHNKLTGLLKTISSLAAFTRSYSHTSYEQQLALHPFFSCTPSPFPSRTTSPPSSLALVASRFQIGRAHV